MQLRRATVSDADSITAIHLAARRAAPMPDPLHPEEGVREWVARWLAVDEAWVAEGSGGDVDAYLRLTPGWLDDLYVRPEAASQGLGSALLDLAKARQPEGFCLWVFETNTPARDFYRRHGLIELETTDGSGNLERAPDVRMAWPGAESLTFLRRLIDDVDDQLGDLLARRLALTRAVQRHKPDQSRDLEREQEIVRRLAQQVPELGEERIARILHAIIGASLEAADDT